MTLDYQFWIILQIKIENTKCIFLIGFGLVHSINTHLCGVKGKFSLKQNIMELTKSDYNFSKYIIDLITGLKCWYYRFRVYRFYLYKYVYFKYTLIFI